MGKPGFQGLHGRGELVTPWEGRMDWITFGVQWLHVLLGIVWFGYSLALAIFFIPAMSRLPITTQRTLAEGLRARGEPIIDVVAPAIIILGIIRGTLLGPIDSVGYVFSTAYGLTWLVALVVAVAVFLWGKFVIVRAVELMNAAPLAADGGSTPELEVALERAKRVTILELLGFLVIFTCMILMRFGQ
jgi:putative copper export protein